MTSKRAGLVLGLLLLAGASSAFMANRDEAKAVSTGPLAATIAADVTAMPALDVFAPATMATFKMQGTFAEAQKFTVTVGEGEMTTPGGAAYAADQVDTLDDFDCPLHEATNADVATASNNLPISLAGMRGGGTNAFALAIMTGPDPTGALNVFDNFANLTTTARARAAPTTALTNETTAAGATIDEKKATSAGDGAAGVQRGAGAFAPAFDIAANAFSNAAAKKGGGAG